MRLNGADALLLATHATPTAATRPDIYKKNIFSYFERNHLHLSCGYVFGNTNK